MYYRAWPLNKPTMEFHNSSHDIWLAHQSPKQKKSSLQYVFHLSLSLSNLQCFSGAFNPHRNTTSCIHPSIHPCKKCTTHEYRGKKRAKDYTTNNHANSIIPVYIQNTPKIKMHTPWVWFLKSNNGQNSAVLRTIKSVCHTLPIPRHFSPWDRHNMVYLKKRYITYLKKGRHTTTINRGKTLV